MHGVQIALFNSGTKQMNTYESGKKIEEEDLSKRKFAWGKW